MSDTTVDAPPLHDPRTYDHGVPYDYYRWLRDNDPVAHMDHPNYPGGYWAVTRHDDVQRVSRDAATFRNAPDPFLDDGTMAPGADGAATPSC